MKERGFTIQDLEMLKFGLESRIGKIESELLCPLVKEVSDKIILKRLLEVERINLSKVNFELEVKKTGIK